MRVAILTIDDELLVGDTANTNATWLVQRFRERGVAVKRILTVANKHSLIQSRVREYSESFSAVIVSGGIGNTPDDLTRSEQKPTLQRWEEVKIGCYPDRDASHNRIKMTATDEETLTSATAWLQNQIDASGTPVGRDYDEDIEYNQQAE